MAYSTQDDLTIEVGGTANLKQLADLEKLFPLTTSIDATIAKAIAEADGIINSYIKQRFAVPLAVVTQEIRGLSARWAARVLRRYNYKGQPLVEDQEAEKIDREWLEGVGGGSIQIGIEPSPPPSDIILDTVGERDSSLIISRARLGGFI